MSRKAEPSQSGAEKNTGGEVAQVWKADRYAEHAPFVPLLGRPVLDLLNPQPGERILDVGCGDGVLSALISEAGATVVGVDGSPDMVAAAKQHGIDARLADAFHLSFQAEFDAAFSNAALHWMKRDPDAVLRGVRRSLKPGGRFAGEFGGHGNVAAITVALLAVLHRHGIKDVASLHPWYFPTAEEYRSKLETAGFHVKSIELFPRPVILPTDMRGWVQTFAGPFTQALPQHERAGALDEVVGLLRPALCDSEGHWTVDYVRLRFLAIAR
ncbi:MAG TPA: methyltransferase domain-containing protein [Terriglobia bacterium]|nr:methyltransferase domain-containing protein [Terriglobia bacterium]